MPVDKGAGLMKKLHMWSRLGMLGKIVVRCGRKVKSTEFTDQPSKVTCVACLNAMAKSPSFKERLNQGSAQS
jgi:hypothetical protein